jgi:hypothetical protein
VGRIEVGENERDGLRMLTAQRAAELLRIGPTQTAEAVAVGELPLNALENLLRLGRPERLLEHVLGELHAAGADRVHAKRGLEPFGEHDAIVVVGGTRSSCAISRATISASSGCSAEVSLAAAEEPIAMQTMATF